jgi:hypothetical protein
MSGLEFVLPLNTIADTRLRRDRGCERARRHRGGAKWQPAHPSWHGAWLILGALLDCCMGLPCSRHCKKGIGQTTLELKVSLVRPITAETEMIMTKGVVPSRAGGALAPPKDGSRIATDDSWRMARRPV